MQISTVEDSNTAIVAMYVLQAAENSFLKQSFESAITIRSSNVFD
jgi:hypothetical protein